LEIFLEEEKVRVANAKLDADTYKLELDAKVTKARNAFTNKFLNFDAADANLAKNIGGADDAPKNKTKEDL